MEEFYLSSSGAGQLHCGLWQPEGTPRAVVQLVHGIAEHIGRYDHFARYLTEHGFAVCADDHMGHGLSVEKGGVYGYFSGGWMAAVEDEKRLMEEMKARFAGVPYIILGHSMGSFLLRTFLYTYPGALDGAIISGTGWEAGLTLKAGLALCRLEERRLGQTGYSGLLKKMMFGAYNKSFQPNRTPNDWICSDEAVVDAYTQDELCGFDVTVGLARDMLGGMQLNQRAENLAKMDKALPVLFVSGMQDPVGAMGAGVLKCIDAFKRAGLKSITIHLYPEGRHEMLNETNRTEVYADILAWLERLA